VRVTVDEGELADLPDAAVNVAGVYAALRDDIRQGAARVAGFAHAVDLSLLIENVFRSSNEGRRLDVGPSAGLGSRDDLQAGARSSDRS